MKFETLKERMEYYRNLTDYKVMPNSYIMVMCDGRSFSKFIKNKFKKPFDDKFISMMNQTASYVCKNVQGCKLAYTQSDEMSFIITDFDTPETDIFFSGRLCKMQSIIASLATGKFNQLMIEDLVNVPASSSDIQQMVKDFTPLQFDCKVWTVPTYNDAFAWLKYRQNDCIKNSKNQAAQTYLPHKSLLGKTADEQINLLKDEKGIDWYTDYNDGEKYGRIIYKVNREILIEKGPNAGQTCMRSFWDAYYAPVFNKEWFDDLGIVPKRND